MSNSLVKKSPLQFSLRTALVGVTVIAFACAAVWTAALPARREYAAAQAIAAHAEAVVKPEELSSSIVVADAEFEFAASRNPAPCVVIDYRPARGVDGFLCWVAGSPGHVQAIGIWGSQASGDCFFANAAKFKWLHAACIFCNKMSASDIANVSRCTELNDLTLACETLRGSELAHLGALTELETLAVKSPQLDCTVFEAVGACRRLRYLHLDGSEFGRAKPECSLRRFSELPLDALILSGDFPDVMLEKTAQLPNLEFLSIRSETLTDSGIALLIHSDSVEHLTIVSPLVTDASIDSLISMKALQYVSLETKISQEDAWRLAEARPEIRQSVSPQHGARISPQTERNP